MPVTFQDMRDEVIANTKRPELASLTDSAIKMATLRAHHVDFFPRDLTSQLLTYTVPVGNELWTDFSSVYDTVPQMRTPNFMQGEDLLTFIPSENLEYVVDFKYFWDENNELKTSVFTMIGDTLRVRWAGATGRARLFYYKNPIVTVGGYVSWIADMHKEELAKWAAAIIWARSGFQEIAKDAQAGVLDFKALLVESYLSSKV